MRFCVLDSVLLKLLLVSFWRLAVCALLPATAALPAQTVTRATTAQDGRTVRKNLLGSQTLAGTVVDRSGAVIGNVKLELRSRDGAVEQHVNSRKNGSFVFTGLYPGDYLLSASSEGFETTQVAVALGASASDVTLTIALAVRTVNTSVTVEGREDLLGVADSATEGSAGAGELQQRPILRAGELLETIPGLLITQHAGGGKANQYFLRGFNLDHGTDFASFLDDMPLNLPSHAHGEGYADMNIVIPELVQRIDFEKGPYRADVGDFGAAGSARIEFFKNLPESFVKVEGGMYGYGRLVFGVSQKTRFGSFLYAGEVFHDNGPWTTHEDNYWKYNGLMTYSRGTAGRGFSVTYHAYRGTWHSSDQIPVTALPLVGYFGALNPTDGGESQRYSLQGEWHASGDDWETKVSAYGFFYDLNLFSDFTYDLDDPAKGDQFEQQDRRWVAGLDARHSVSSRWLGRRMENSVGVQVRNDWVHNGLFRTENRVRTAKNDVNACNDEPVDACNGNSTLVTLLPAATDLNRFSETLAGIYAENKAQWTGKFRSALALRGDAARDVVTNLTPEYISNIPALATPVDFAQLNSGSAGKILLEPKLSLVAGPWRSTEFYAQGGFSFHTNDARGATQREEPVSPDNPFPTPSTPITPLVQLKGGEFGVRTAALAGLNSTFSLWYLRSNSELQQDGDTGSTVASQQSSNRYGVEWANVYSAAGHVMFDLDVADSRAQFTATDAADAAYINPTPANGLSYPMQLQGGKLVPEAVRVVVSSGLILHGYRGFDGTVRLRYFGPRDLTSDGINRSSSSTLVNAAVSYRMGEHWRISCDLLNLLNRRNDDITYAYISRITPQAAAMFSNVFHPAEPFQARFWLERTF